MTMNISFVHSLIPGDVDEQSVMLHRLVPAGSDTGALGLFLLSLFSPIQSIYSLPIPYCLDCYSFIVSLEIS